MQNWNPFRGSSLLLGWGLKSLTWPTRPGRYSPMPFSTLPFILCFLLLSALDIPWPALTSTKEPCSSAPVTLAGVSPPTYPGVAPLCLPHLPPASSSFSSYWALKWLFSGSLPRLSDELKSLTLRAEYPNTVKFLPNIYPGYNFTSTYATFGSTHPPPSSPGCKVSGAGHVHPCSRQLHGPAQRETVGGNYD